MQEENQTQKTTENDQEKHDIIRIIQMIHRGDIYHCVPKDEFGERTNESSSFRVKATVREQLEEMGVKVEEAKGKFPEFAIVDEASLQNKLGGPQNLALAREGIRENRSAVRSYIPPSDRQI